MKIRTSLAGVVAATVVASALATATPAFAAYTVFPNDPTFISSGADLQASDLIGVGSDTTEIAVHKLAEAFTAQAGAPFRVVSYQAKPQPDGGTVPLRDGTEITRPNGSGAGKALLHGAGNNPNIDFARSSDALDDTKLEVTHGLQLIPFAVDTLKMGVASPTYAPASLSLDQIYRIYTGEFTDWGQVGGVAGHAIKASALQTGSGTAKFFQKQLEAYAATLGTTFSFGANIDKTWQEHADFPASLTAEERAGAIAPFSVGRAALIPNTPITMEGGWEKKRALYDVVRGASCTNPDTSICPADKAGIGLGDPKLDALFGSNGFWCSDAAKPLIEAGGFKQMLRPEFGGRCGVATQNAETNFSIEATATTTSLTPQSTTAGAAHLAATVSPSATGTVQFYVDGVATGDPVQTQGGAASYDASGLTPGSHTFKAAFEHDFGTAFTDSDSGDVAGSVKSGSTAALSFSAAPTYGKATTVTVTTTGVADGQTVAIKVGSAAAVSRTVTAGKATLVLPANKPAGSYAVTASYAGNAEVASSSATRSLTIAKAAPVISETFPTATLVGKPGKGVVKVALAGSTLKPTGKVTIKMGTKVVKAAVSLVNGQVTITLPKLTKGKHTLTIVYSGSPSVKAGSKSFTITQK